MFIKTKLLLLPDFFYLLRQNHFNAILCVLGMLGNDLSAMVNESLKVSDLQQCAELKMLASYAFFHVRNIRYILVLQLNAYRPIYNSFSHGSIVRICCVKSPVLEKYCVCSVHRTQL